ncbi:AMP-dependent synthetase [Fibrobacterales bacterium]|nr:AMP-dependent synthetase [Fibrobacterales bacterium]
MEKNERVVTMGVFEIPTLPALAMQTFKDARSKSFYHRVGENWKQYSPEDMLNSIYHFSLALKEAGVEKGVGVGIIAPSSPKWYIIDIATQICGGYVVPLFSNISSEHFEFQIKDAQVKVLVIDSWEALPDQIAEQSLKIPTLIHFENLPNQIKHANAHSWEKFIEAGKSAVEISEVSAKVARSWYEEQLSSIKPEDIFSIIYTSGSTGTPKGVPLTHKNMLVQLRSISEIFPLSENDICMSILPVAHVFERMAVFYFSGSGLPVYFADTPNNVGKYLPEIKPSVLTVVPRVVEKLYEKLVDSANGKSLPIKLLMKHAIKKAKFTDPEKVSLKGSIWDKLVYSKMRVALGGNFKLLVSGSSALNVACNRFLRNLGLPMLEGYGMTECSPVISAECPSANRLGTVGKPLSCLQVKIGEGSEIQVKGESVFSGYWNHPELNSEIFTEDGYFRTGDKGGIDSDGYIKITGRLKEMFKLSTGKYVSPVPIEQALSQRAFIEAAQVFADGRKFTSAIIFLNPDLVAAKLKKKFGEFNQEIALKSRRINAEIQKAVDIVNKNLNEWEKVKKWRPVFAILSTENGLLTPTMKLRRNAVEKKFEGLIEEIYR